MMVFVRGEDASFSFLFPPCRSNRCPRPQRDFSRTWPPAGDTPVRGPPGNKSSFLPSSFLRALRVRRVDQAAERPLRFSFLTGTFCAPSSWSVRRESSISLVFRATQLPLSLRQYSLTVCPPPERRQVLDLTLPPQPRYTFFPYLLAPLRA